MSKRKLQSRSPVFFTFVLLSLCLSSSQCLSLSLSQSLLLHSLSLSLSLVLGVIFIFVFICLCVLCVGPSRARGPAQQHAKEERRRAAQLAEWPSDKWGGQTQYLDADEALVAFDPLPNQVLLVCAHFFDPPEGREEKSIDSISQQALV